MRLFLTVNLILATTFALHAQSPGIDPRGLAAYSSPVIIGLVEEPWRMVIRSDKLPKAGPVKPRPDGTYISQLPQVTFEHLIGYVFRIRVQEVLKRDGWVRANQTIEIFAPFTLEGGVSLPLKKRFLLALVPFSPMKEDFFKTTVLKVGESLYQQGVPFDLRARYYVVAGDANGAVSITAKNGRLIQEIRAAIRAR